MVLCGWVVAVAETYANREICDRFSGGDDRCQPAFRKFNCQCDFECLENLPMSSGRYSRSRTDIRFRNNGNGREYCPHGSYTSQQTASKVSQLFYFTMLYKMGHTTRKLTDTKRRICIPNFAFSDKTHLGNTKRRDWKVGDFRPDWDTIFGVLIEWFIQIAHKKICFNKAKNSCLRIKEATDVWS